MRGDNGYSPSILPGHSEHCCWLCGRNGCGKMDRHEIFHGAYRSKAKAYGLWVHLCHDECHLNGVHQYAELEKGLKQEGQRLAMEVYGWTTEEFIKQFGRNYLDAEQN